MTAHQNYKPIVLIVAAVALFAGRTSLSADIVLRQKVTPVKPVIVLGDIADIRTGDIAERQRLALVPLWVAPPFGEQRFVTPQQVQSILASRGYAAAGLNIYGASTVAIGWDPTAKKEAENESSNQAAASSSEIAGNSMGFRVPRRGKFSSLPVAKARKPVFLSELQRKQLADQVREAAVAYLEDQTGKFGAIEVDFNLPRRTSDLLSLQTSEVTITGGRAPWFGRQSLSVTFDSEQGPVEKSLSVIVYDTTPVLIAKRPIARGQLLTAAVVSIETPSRDARRSSREATIHSLEEAIGKEASRAIREGDIVTAQMCLQPLMISRNEIVQIISSGGGIVIRRQAKALADARKGEVAEVELLDSDKRLVARVVGPGQLATLGGTAFGGGSSPAGPTASYR